MKQKNDIDRGKKKGTMRGAAHPNTAEIGMTAAFRTEYLDF